MIDRKLALGLEWDVQLIQETIPFWSKLHIPIVKKCVYSLFK
jgi:hypothetical protein